MKNERPGMGEVKKRTHRFRNVFFGLLFLLTVTGLYVLFTPHGSRFAFKSLLRSSISQEGMDWDISQGTLLQGLTYENIELTNLDILPLPNRLRVGKISIDVNGLNLKSVNVSIENARLLLPDSDPILFHGTLFQGKVDCSLYSKTFALDEIQKIIPKVNISSLDGEFRDVDLVFKGPIDELALTGEIGVVRAQKDQIVLEDSGISLDLKLKKTRSLEIYGPAFIEGGVLYGPKTASIRLLESRVVFQGGPQKPDLNIFAQSNVQKVKIKIKLTGSLEQPDVDLSSQPSMPEQRLLLMLLTNKTWAQTEEALGGGQLSLDVAKDFVDYFLLGGTGQKIAKSFGLKDISFQYNGQAKGVTVSKDVLKNLEANYQIEQKKTQNQPGETVQKVGGEYQLNDNISVEAKREILKDQQAAEQKPAEGEVFIKYMKSF